MSSEGRPNQRFRTRKDIVQAAARLMKQGRSPTIAEVAEEALVSRATAYRYFPSQEALIAEAPLHGSVPTAESVFEGEPTEDPVSRVDKAEAALHRAVHRNPIQFRVLLARLLEQSIQQKEPGSTPLRQNRRGELIDAALAPCRDELDDSVYAKLYVVLAHLFGTESMVITEDVLQIDADEARAAKSWAIETLVQAALAQSKAGV